MSWIALEYLCPECGTIFESLERRSDPAASLPHCNSMAERTISCPMVITQGVNVTRSVGRSDPPPGAMSTQAIADGMPTGEWKRKRSEQRKAARKAWVRKQVS